MGAFVPDTPGSASGLCRESPKKYYKVFGQEPSHYKHIAYCSPAINGPLTTGSRQNAADVTQLPQVRRLNDQPGGEEFMIHKMSRANSFSDGVQAYARKNLQSSSRATERALGLTLMLKSVCGAVIE